MNPSILKGTFSLFDPFEKHKVTSDKRQGARAKPFLAPVVPVRVSERSTQGRVTRHTAIKAARFIETNLRNHNGQLLKSYRQGKGKQSAHLDHYAFLSWACWNSTKQRLSPTTSRHR